MNKLDDLIALAGICSTDHVLDIGFGWGSGAIRAVQTTGCRYKAEQMLSMRSTCFLKVSNALHPFSFCFPDVKSAVSDLLAAKKNKPS